MTSIKKKQVLTRVLKKDFHKLLIALGIRATAMAVNMTFFLKISKRETAYYYAIVLANMHLLGLKSAC